MPRRRPPDPRQLLLPAGPPRAPSFARVFEVDPTHRVALTPGLALAFRADYREALRAVREAGDHREARAARDAVRDLGAVYFAYMAALQASLRAPDVRPEVADQFMRGVLLSRLAFTVPFDEARDTVGRRVAYGSFVRARGPWEVMAWRAASRAFENLERYAGNLPRTLHLAREERVMVAGVPVGVGSMARATAARAIDVLDAALRILREQRRVPWLLSRLPPIAITSECERSGVTMQGEYDPATRRILICAGSMLGATPLAVAHTIAHEAGHHLWRTSLSDAAQDAWRREVALAVERVPVRAVLALWPEGDTLDDVVRRLRTLNPPLSLALQGAHERGSLRGWTKREAWTAWLARDPNAAVDLSSAPVSAYGAKDPEEAFCEALGLLAAYGLRAVLPEVAQWLRAVVPAVRPKGNRRPMPRKRNSAIARRGEGDDAEPARTTADHWTDPAVIEAARIAESVQRGYNRRMGAGNFGVGYRADTPSGPRLVKLPAEHNLHEQPWSRAQQTAHIMHEAGVANELSALGYSLIPRGVYTEWGGGTPAFVREFGEPVTSLTPAEYGAVEAELLSIERDHGWMVVDELQLYRRPDGSVYVGDVGLWQPPPRAKRAWSLRWSGLHRYLEDLQRRTLPGLAMRPRDARWVAPAPGYEHVDRIPVATLPLLVGHAERIREHAAQTSRKALALSQSFAVRAARSLIQGVSERDAHGIHTPDTVRAALPIAHEVAALPEDEDDE